MSKGNGKIKRKRGRPKAGTGVKKKLCKIVAVKHDGNATKMAEDLGISQQAVSKHLQKPEIKQAVLSAREKALRGAKITQRRVFNRIGKNLDSPLPDLQKHAIDRSLSLLGENDGQPALPTTMINMPVIMIDARKISFDVGSDKDVLDV